MDGVIFILFAYLVGAFPFVYFLGRLRGYDLREEEDMHLSMWRKVGRVEGVIAILWEVVKGGAVIGLGYGIGVETWALAMGGLAVVGGQMWSAFMGFQGEKGNSTGVGMAVVLVPGPFLVALIPILTGVTIKLVGSLRDKSKSVNRRFDFAGSATLAMPLGMLGGFVVLPLASWFFGLSGWIVVSLFVLVGLILLKRATDGIGADMEKAEDKRQIVINRLLYDRSYR